MSHSSGCQLWWWSLCKRESFVTTSLSTSVLLSLANFVAHHIPIPLLSYCLCRLSLEVLPALLERQLHQQLVGRHRPYPLHGSHFTAGETNGKWKLKGCCTADFPCLLVLLRFTGCLLLHEKHNPLLLAASWFVCFVLFPSFQELFKAHKTMIAFHQ